MAWEIERKFLVTGDIYRAGATGVLFRQGYLNSDPERTVRIRVAGDNGFLTVKGFKTDTMAAEFEYRIPLQDARALLELCEKPLIEKTRYQVEVDGFEWEIDEFLGDNQGLVLAEIELEEAGATFPRPEWLGEEVTDDPRYFNSSLIRNPYKNWRGK